MKFLRNLFGKAPAKEEEIVDKTNSKTKTATQTKKLSKSVYFPDVMQVDNYVVRPQIKEMLIKNYDEDNKAQNVLMVAATLLEDMEELSFKVFDMKNDATILCKLNSEIANKMSNGISCDFALKTFTDYGYPILRLIVFLDFPDGSTTEVEHYFNIEDVDIQEFFDSNISTKDMFVHLVVHKKEGGITSKGFITITSSEERNELMKEEISKAVECYRSSEIGFNEAVEKFR